MGSTPAERRSLQVVGHRSGFRKIGFTKLLRVHGEIGLRDAHRLTCRLLDGEAIVVSVREPDAFAALAEELGALLEVLP